MPLCCAMSRGRQEEERAAAVAPRRGRWFGEEPRPTTTAGWRCRACAAAAIADCVALGCCPCAVVALLGLALVRAPLAVGRRLRGRRRSLLRRKRVRDVAAGAAATALSPRDKGANKAAAAPGAGGGARPDADDAATVAAAAAPGKKKQQEEEEAEAAELAWLDEMYRAGHWGFGRVSIGRRWEDPVTVTPPVRGDMTLTG